MNIKQVFASCLFTCNNQIENMTIPLILLQANRAARNVSDTLIGNVFDPAKDVVLITGGCSGLGKELVSVFQQHKATVVVLDLELPSASEQVENVNYFQCDVSDKDRILEVKKIIDQEIGSVSILINNAGFMTGKPLVDLSFEEIETTIQVNLLSNFYTNKIFLPTMIANKRGYIVTVASVLAYMLPAWLSAYGASKAGLIALHESLTYELGPPSLSPTGVKTLLVAPGQLRTPMFNGVTTPSQLLAPELDASYVASIIFSALELGRRGEIKVPFYGNILPIFRALPWRVTEIARHYSGIDTSMTKYKGQINKLKEKSRSIASFGSQVPKVV